MADQLEDDLARVRRVIESLNEEERKLVKLIEARGGQVSGEAKLGKPRCGCVDSWREDCDGG